MTNYNQLLEIILDTIFFIVPVAGVTLWLFKVLGGYINDLKSLRDNNTLYRPTVVKITLTSVSILLGLFLCLFMTWLIFFPSFKIPKIVKIFGFILYAGFWGCTGILYGLGKAVSAGAGSVTGILNKLFNTISEKDNPQNQNLKSGSRDNHK